MCATSTKIHVPVPRFYFCDPFKREYTPYAASLKTIRKHDYSWIASAFKLDIIGTVEVCQSSHSDKQ